MNIKRKAVSLTILPMILGGFSLNAIAVTSAPIPPAGPIYTFTADLNYSFSDLSLQISDFNNDYMGYTMDLSPYINQDVTRNFTEANPSISGQFTYNSSAPQTNTYTFDTYTQASYNTNNESFTLNLSSENGEAGQVFVGENSGGYRYKRMTLGTDTPVAPATGYQIFHIYGYGGNPNVTLSGSSNFDCEFGPCGEGGGYFIQDYRPHDDLTLGINDDLPEFFADIESFSFELFPYLGLDEPSSELTYQLDNVSMSLNFAGHDNLPTDNTLPDTLPALDESRYANLSLSFDTGASDYYIYGNDVSIWDIQFTEDSPINDILDENDYWNYYYDKEIQLYDVLYDSYLEGYADIGYTITELEALADGLTADTPLLPDPDLNPNDGIFNFSFTPNPNGFTFIDPDVAVGYDYQITAGTNLFTDVLLPTGYGDNLFELWLFDNLLGDFVDTGTTLEGGVAYNFGPSGVDLFRIMGIETTELLDPNDANAFTTGLVYLDPSAPVNMSQTAITVFVTDTVPAPTTLILLMSGIIGFAVRQRKA